MNPRRVNIRLDSLPPWVVDTTIAVGLAVLACSQLWLFDRFQPPFRIPPTSPPGIGGAGGALPYLLVAAVFLPLSLRRVWPWVALVASGVFALLYGMHPFPPTFTTLAPMIGMYSVASYARRRHAGVVALVVGGLVVGVPTIAFSSTRLIAQVVGTFALLAAAMLFGDSTRSRREYIAEVERRAAEAERALEEEARRRVEEERTRIARDVHDVVAHSLSIVAIQAAAADALIESDPQQARHSIGHVRATAKQALSELRSTLDMLRTGEEDPPLAPTADLGEIESLVGPVREAGIEVDLRIQGDLRAVPVFASVSAYRIVQEALTNVVRHAHASSVQVSLAIGPGWLDIEVVAEAENGEEAVRLSAQSHPDVILMDIRMPVMDGLEATRRILVEKDDPAPRVLILTTFDADEYVYEALRAGASGFLLKDTEPEQLISAVRVIAAGDGLLAPCVTRRLIREFATRSEVRQSRPERLSALTERELEILTLVAQGLSNGEIAAQLFISPATAKTHVSRVLMKLDARDRAQLVVMAYENGLVVPAPPFE